MVGPILICEDDEELAELLEGWLRRERFATRIARTGQSCLDQLRVEPPPCLLLLDLGLPDLNGTEVCRRLRADPQLSGLPIVVISARAEEIDRVVAFELGADDYVVKPFSMRELALRIRAQLRRAGPGLPPPRPTDDSPPARLVHGEIAVDPSGHQTWVAGRSVDLTAQEFRLLCAFLGAPGRALTRGELLDHAWPGSDATERAVDAHLRRLRAKLGFAGAYIETLRGVGYRLKSDPDER
jgi:two-component system phosphate regulon response regulator PhoB